MKNLIKHLKNVKLSQKEKDVLRYRISEFISFNPIRGDIGIKKQAFYFSIFTLRALSRGVALVLMVLIVVGGTGVSYASTDALPGDALYPIKVNINEKIEERLALTPAAKLIVQTEKVERRLNEAQMLAELERLSPDRKAIVKENLEKNVESVAKSIETLKQSGKIKEALSATSKITPVLEAHKEILVENTKPKIAEAPTEDAVMMSMVADTQLSDVPDTTGQEDATIDTLLETVDKAIKTVEGIEEAVLEMVADNKELADEVTELNTEEIIKKIKDLRKEGLKLEEERKKQEDMDGKVPDETKIDAVPATEVNDPELRAKEMPAEEISDDSTLLLDVDTLLKDTDTLNMLAPADQAILLQETTIKNEGDVTEKIEEAERLLMQAESKKSEGNYKEALTLSQKARKIMQEIEIYRRVKELQAQSISLNSAKEAIKETEAKEVVAPIAEEKELSPEEPTDTQESLSDKIEDTLPTEKTRSDMKAEAILSIERAYASFQKLSDIEGITPEARNHQ